MMAQESGPLPAAQAAVLRGGTHSAKARNQDATAGGVGQDFADLLREGRMDAPQAAVDGMPCEEPVSAEASAPGVRLLEDADAKKASSVGDLRSDVLMPGTVSWVSENLQSEVRPDRDVTGIWLQMAVLTGRSGAEPLGTPTPAGAPDAVAMPVNPTHRRDPNPRTVRDGPSGPQDLCAPAGSGLRSPMPQSLVAQPAQMADGASTGREVSRTIAPAVLGRDNLPARSPAPPTDAPEPSAGLQALAGEWKGLLEPMLGRAGSGRSEHRDASPKEGASTGAGVPDSSAVHEVVQPANDVAGPQGADVSFVDTANYWIAQGVQNAEMSVDGFGDHSVGVRVSMSGEQAQVSFNSDAPEVRQLLEQALPQLKEALAGEGLMLAGAFVGSSDQRGDTGASEQRSRRAARRIDVGVVGSADVQPAPASRGRGPGSGRSIDLFV